MSFLLKLIPQEDRAYIDLCRNHIFQRLDTKEERMASTASFVKKQKSDGYISGPELLVWGAEIGVTRKDRKRKAPNLKLIA